MVVGADAVGVACLSGPVLAAAVVMPAYGRRIPGVRDSKMLSRAQRERLYPKIMRGALAVGLGAASVAEIDRINIYHATNLAMRRAICRVSERQHVLIDGLRVYRFEDFIGSYTAIVHGDARCYSIAAASIVAKVVRDRLMERLAARYPHYGWEHNAGYATFTHRRGIEEQGHHAVPSALVRPRARHRHRGAARAGAASGEPRRALRPGVRRGKRGVSRR